MVIVIGQPLRYPLSHFKGKCQEMSTFCEVFKDNLVLFVLALMFFTIFGRVFYVETNKKSHTNSENHSSNPLQEAGSGLEIAC